MNDDSAIFDQHAGSSMSVAVIVPVYNRAKVILATLESIARQTAPPTKLVVVDDGSTDDTCQAVAAWIDAAQPPFAAELLRQPHGSAAAARNTGLAAIGEAPVVAFLDSDDCWPEDFLERTTRSLKNDPTAVAATVDRRFFDSHGGVFQFDDAREVVGDPIAWFFAHGAGVASSTLFRTAAIRAAGGWNTQLDSAEDSMLFSLVALEGRWVHAAGAPVDFHHGNAVAIAEENNLSYRYLDALRRWAGVYEQVFDAIDERYPRRRREHLRRHVAVYWYRAGKQLEQLGQPTDARDCYSRAIRWNPAMWRAWKRRFFLTAPADAPVDEAA